MMLYDFILSYTYFLKHHGISAALGWHIVIALDGLSSSNISNNEHIMAFHEASPINH